MKYGKEITDEIANHIKLGMGRVDACRLANIHYDTFTVWMEKPEFSESIKRAESEFKQRNVAIIQRAAIKSWQAAAWLLERKFFDEFGIKNNVQGVIKVDSTPLEKLSDGQLERIIRQTVSQGTSAPPSNGNGHNGAQA